MQRITTRTILIPRILRSNISPSTKLICRSFSTTKTQKTPHLPLKTISFSVALTSFLYIYSGNIAKAEANSPASAFARPSPDKVLSELHNKENNIALQTKTTQELAVALFVYRMCSIPWLVDVAPSIIATAERLHLHGPVYWFIRQTFFRHFCGGETSEECISNIDRLAQSGIRCILDLSVEADFHVDKKPTDEEGQGKYYSEEQKADIVLEMTKNCIQTATRGERFSAMVAIKITAFSPPELLLRLNQTIASLDQSFLEFQENGFIDAHGLSQVIQKAIPPAKDQEQQEQRQSVINRLKRERRSLDLLDFRDMFNLQDSNRDIWWNTDQTNDKSKKLTCQDLEAYDRMIDRVNQACSLAYQLKVGIMVDAEQSYFQDAIDHVAINLQRKYNHPIEGDQQAPTIFNTYQMYTKLAQRKLELDVELSKRENFVFAAKLVRGAYMVSECRRALEMNYPSPIHETLEDTHNSYNGGVKFLLHKLCEHKKLVHDPLSVNNSPIVFMVASHNYESVKLTIEEMEKNQIPPHSGVVLFGQLFSMQDQISFTLAHHGYVSYKYLPYGIIDEVIPYLIRRAQENSAVLGGSGAVHEHQLVWNELKKRITGKTSVDVPITGATTSSV